MNFLPQLISHGKFEDPVFYPDMLSVEEKTNIRQMMIWPLVAEVLKSARDELRVAKVISCSAGCCKVSCSCEIVITTKSGIHAITLSMNADNEYVFQSSHLDIKDKGKDKKKMTSKKLGYMCKTLKKRNTVSQIVDKSLGMGYMYLNEQVKDYLSEVEVIPAYGYPVNAVTHYSALQCLLENKPLSNLTTAEQRLLTSKYKEITDSIAVANAALNDTKAVFSNGVWLILASDELGIVVGEGSLVWEERNARLIHGTSRLYKNLSAVDKDMQSKLRLSLAMLKTSGLKASNFLDATDTDKLIPIQNETYKDFGASGRCWNQMGIPSINYPQAWVIAK